MYVFPYELLSNTQLFKILMGLHGSKDCISTIKGETRGKHDSEFLLNNLMHNAHRGIFSPLIASADICSFFFLSIYHHLSPLFSNYCNFMWFIKLRASAGMCGVCAHGRGCVCVRVCIGVSMCVQVYIHVRGWVWVGGCLCARVCAVCAGVHGCVWKFAEVCGSAWVSVSVCVGWIFRISSGD